MDDSKNTELKRRDVLKRGAVATGVLVVGGTAMSGSVTAAGGGEGFVSVDGYNNLSGNEFVFTDTVPGRAIEHSAGCSQSSDADTEVFYGTLRADVVDGSSAAQFFPVSSSQEVDSSDTKRIASPKNLKTCGQKARYYIVRSDGTLDEHPNSPRDIVKVTLRDV